MPHNEIQMELQRETAFHADPAPEVTIQDIQREERRQAAEAKRFGFDPIDVPKTDGDRLKESFDAASSMQDDALNKPSGDRHDRKWPDNDTLPTSRQTRPNWPNKRITKLEP